MVRADRPFGRPCVRTERTHQAAGPHVKVSARPPSARRAHRAFSPSSAPVPLGRRRRGGACAVIRLHMTRGVAGSAAIDAAALFVCGVPAGERWRVGSRAVTPTCRSATWPPVARHGARCCPLETALHWYRTPSRLCRLSRRSIVGSQVAGRRGACGPRSPGCVVGRAGAVVARSRCARWQLFACHRVGAPSGRRAAVGLLLAGVSRLVRPSFWNDAYVDLLWKWP